MVPSFRIHSPSVILTSDLVPINVLLLSCERSRKVQGNHTGMQGIHTTCDSIALVMTDIPVVSQLSVLSPDSSEYRSYFSLAMTGPTTVHNRHVCCTASSAC